MGRRRVFNEADRWWWEAQRRVGGVMRRRGLSSLRLFLGQARQGDLEVDEGVVGDGCVCFGLGSAMART